MEKNNKYNGKTYVLGVKNLKGMLPVTQTRPNQSDQGSNTNKKKTFLCLEYPRCWLVWGWCFPVTRAYNNDQNECV